ncbi:hypothetical protein ONZ43_g367 [Nemania bipapillata]|uniref:Uncharacterized protein n=1 Tax=Nemania bipapillata TaxID=110536 RepID=A0ACC2J8X3_9PEZI|nr:hypothetical protein ONZ43_g367 [Nemania bipapillata]
MEGVGVYGLVYRLHPKDEKQLDLCEGVGFAYEREMLEVTWAGASDQNSVEDAHMTTVSTISNTISEETTGETGTRREKEPMPGLASKKFDALVYVDCLRVKPSRPKDEYVKRMNVGIADASEHWGLPMSYVDEVIRPYIPAPSDGYRTSGDRE